MDEAKRTFKSSEELNATIEREQNETLSYLALVAAIETETHPVFEDLKETLNGLECMGTYMAAEVWKEKLERLLDDLPPFMTASEWGRANILENFYLETIDKMYNCLEALAHEED